MVSTDGAHMVYESRFRCRLTVLAVSVCLAILVPVSAESAVGEGVTSNGLLIESFESGLPLDWTTTGLWHVTDECADEIVGCSTSGWLYFGLSDQCDFATSDAESGVVLSPPVTIPGDAVSLTLSYCSRYNGERGASPDGFDSAWVAVNGDMVDDVSFRNQRMGDWQERTIELNDYIGQEIELSWQFDSIDRINNGLLGWQVDDVRLMATMPAAGLPSCAESDVNCDGTTNSVDLGIIRSIANFNHAVSGPESPADPRADVNSDGFVNSVDVGIVRAQGVFNSATGPCSCD